ncbi:MAG: protease inhibitor I42 family protein [Candidatus Peribacteraceae bacterium]|jgi:inhibitor of cysteine peptidase
MKRLLPLAALALLTLAACGNQQPAPSKEGTNASSVSSEATAASVGGAQPAQKQSAPFTDIPDILVTGPSELAVGQTFRIVLQSNPTTGYSWTVTLTGDTVSKVSDTFEESQAAGRVTGAPGHQIFQFRAEKPGMTTLTFAYARPWESVQPLETKTYEMTVK